MVRDESIEELLTMARGLMLKAAIHDRIANVALTGAEATEDVQIRVGALAWAHDEARTHRALSRDLTERSRALYGRAAALEATGGIPLESGSGDAAIDLPAGR